MGGIGLPAWMGEVPVGEAVLWVAGLVTAFMAVRKGWPFLRRLVAVVDALGGLPAWMESTSRSLADTSASLLEVRHEVLPNHGGSLRDAVDRTEESQIALSGQVKTLTGEVSAVKEKLAKDHTRIAVLEAVQPRDERGRFAKGD